MASPYLLNAGPGQDKFSDLYNKYDSAVDEIIDGASLVGDDLILSKYNGTNFIVDLSALAGGGASEYVYHEVGLPNSPYQLPEIYHSVVGVYTSFGATTIDLPINPLEQPRLISIRDLQDNASTNKITIRFNSVTVFSIDTDGEGITIAYDNIQGQYILISNYNSSGSGGTPYTIERSSVFAPGPFNVPTPGTEAERIVTLDSGIGSGSYTINLPTSGVSTNYRITVKRVNLSPLTHTIAISAGTGTIDSLSGAVNMNFSQNESISLIARPGATIGTYDWQRDDNYIDPAAIGGGFDYNIIQLNAAASPHTLVWTGVPIYAICDTSGGPHIVNLPAASSAKKRVTIKRRELGWGTGSNNITITPSGSDTIEGVAASISLQNQQAAVTLIYDPSIGGWYKESNYYALSLETEGGSPLILTPVGSPHSLNAFPRGRNTLILVDTSSGNVTVVMPTAPSPGVTNCIFTIKKIASANAVIINSPALIDGSSSLLLSGAFEAARLIFSSGQWRRI